MPQINILNLLQGDNQSTIVDKINYNFDQLLSAGGGPQGQKGLIGPTGPIGPQGYQGVQGVQGPSGTKWFVQDNAPASGSIGGNNPFLYPTIGDYWLDPNSPNQDIYVFTSASPNWIPTGFGLGAGDIFQNLSGIETYIGFPTIGALLAGDVQDVSKKSLILSDASISNYQSAGLENTNFENTKLKISTKTDRQKLVTFSRSDYDTMTNIAGGFTGGTGSNNNPSIQWDSIIYSDSPSYFDLTFKNPAGSMGIRADGLSGGYINLRSHKDINEVSESENIVLSTVGYQKGILNRISPTGGSFEISNISSPTGNQQGAYLYVNQTGVGIGIGTGQFKQSGTGPRKLAIFGNTSISKSLTGHSDEMFIGTNNSMYNYDKGSLFVEGHVALGYTGPNSTPFSIASTGPFENAGAYPQVFITNKNFGPALQVRSGGTMNYAPRTIIGNGYYDAQSGNDAAGVLNDINQEIFFSLPASAPIIGTTAGISYQHKMTDATNTSSTAPVFSITSFVDYTATNIASVATKTLIQTKNSNTKLYIEANGTTGDNNKVIIGTNGSGSIAIHGTGTNKDKATVTIGYNPLAYPGIGGGISGATAKFHTSQDGGNTHALVVNGVQTIGTNNPVSEWTLAANSSKCVGAVSMLKINRFIGAQENYPNGLEISTIYKYDPVHAGPYNDSVALAIGLRASHVSTITKGFLVNNEGTTVGIGGACPGTGGALNITPLNNGVAINTTGTIICSGFSGGGSTPIGGIIMWSGAVDSTVFDLSGADTGRGIGILEGWALCNGNNGTPNLAGRFIVGYGHSALGGGRLYWETMGNTGGEDMHRLAIEELPSHTHDVRSDMQYPTIGIGAPDEAVAYQSAQHSMFDTEPRGNNEPHENRPPYYVLAYIMRIQ